MWESANVVWEMTVQNTFNARHGAVEQETITETVNRKQLVE